MKVIQPIIRVEKKEPEVPTFTAVQYIEGEKLPDGVFLKTVVDRVVNYDEETGKEEIEEVKVEKAFIATKDVHGDRNIDEKVSSIGNGCWILTASDGSVSIVHPTVFEKEFKKEKN